MATVSNGFYRIVVYSLQHKVFLILGSMLFRPRLVASGYWKPLAFFSAFVFLSYERVLDAF